MASTPSTTLQFTGPDVVPVIRKQSVLLGDGTTRQLSVPVEITLDELHERLFTDPAGLQEVRIDRTFDLTALGAAYVEIATLPAGSKVKLAKFQILSTVTDDGTGDSLAIGTNAGTPALLLQGAANLAANYQIGSVPADAASLIAAETAIDLCATVNADGSLSDGELTAGSVRVLLVYDKPVVLANV
jgi:hypothetical protein